MAEIFEEESSQGYWCRRVVMDPNDVVVVEMDKEPQPWDKGGLSWTIKPNVDGQAMDTAVEHSLTSEGETFIPNRESPFSEPTGGNESNRVSRNRYTNNAAVPLQLVVLSAAVCTIREP